MPLVASHTAHGPSAATLVLVARAPERGCVKTRLAAAIGAEDALSLYRAFLEDASRQYAGLPGIAAVLAWDSAGGVPPAEGLFGPPWRIRKQGPGDLGKRLALIFEQEFAAGSGPVGVTGSDHPSLPRTRLLDAFRAGAEGRAAVVPAEDGGFCLLVLPRGLPAAALLEAVPWSSERTFFVLAERARAAGVPLQVLDSWYDVDRISDLERLRADLDGRDDSAPDFPAATRRWLSEAGMKGAR
jgi:uncharacterized protein